MTIAAWPRSCLTALVLIVACGAFLPAVAQSSPYLHLGHPAYAEIDLLVERGVLHGLSPVVRPYRRGDVARAVVAADTTRLTAVERAWLRRLRSELLCAPGSRDEGSTEQGAVRSVAATLTVEGSALSQRHRDPLRPEGKGLVTGAAELDLRAVFGNVVAESRLRSDNYYLHDPQFPGRVATNRFNQRAEDAYVEVQGRHVRALVGRLYRSWAPAGVAGTLLSDYAYSFDQVALWAGTDELSLSLVAARLDDFPGDVRRYVALHRLDWRPSADLALYAAEAVLYGGAGRDFQLEFLTPVSLWFTESENERSYGGAVSNNALIGAGFWWRARPSLVVFGDFTLDDVQVDAAAEPPSYAMFVGVALPRLGPALAGRVTYTQVASLAYRTPADFERYTFRDVGLARDMSDYDQVAAELRWFPRSDVMLRPRVDVLRRGAGDFRAAWPADYSGVATVLSGVVETTVRVSAGGRWYRRDWGVLEGELGESFVRNAGHVRGVSRERFVGRLGARVALRLR